MVWLFRSLPAWRRFDSRCGVGHGAARLGAAVGLARVCCNCSGYAAPARCWSHAHPTHTYAHIHRDTRLATTPSSDKHTAVVCCTMQAEEIKAAAAANAQATAPAAGSKCPFAGLASVMPGGHGHGHGAEGKAAVALKTVDSTPLVTWLVLAALVAFVACRLAGVVSIQ